MDSGRSKEAGRLTEVKTIKKKPHRDFDYWPPNRGGRLIGGHLRLLPTFAGALREKNRTRASFNKTPTNYIS